jgi:hypothetical protein
LAKIVCFIESVPSQQLLLRKLSGDDDASVFWPIKVPMEGSNFYESQLSQAVRFAARQFSAAAVGVEQPQKLLLNQKLPVKVALY